MRRKRRANTVLIKYILFMTALALGIVGVIFSFYGPALNYLEQEKKLNEVKSELVRVRVERDNKRQRVQDLKDPNYMEKLARQQFNYVKPGEKAFVVAGAPQGESTEPISAEPIMEPKGWWQRLLDRLSELVN